MFHMHAIESSRHKPDISRIANKKIEKKNFFCMQICHNRQFRQQIILKIYYHHHQYLTVNFHWSISPQKKFFFNPFADI